MATIAALFTQVLSNTATAVLIAPVALAMAQRLGVEPYAFLMTVTIAASMAFASPVNTLVMGVGNYRFGDYIKVGLPMIVIGDDCHGDHAAGAVSVLMSRGLHPTAGARTGALFLAWTISAMTLTAISAGEHPPRGRPIGPCSRAS